MSIGSERKKNALEAFLASLGKIYDFSAEKSTKNFLTIDTVGNNHDNAITY